MRNTPEAVKRMLRQEAAFGCCKCGFPFFQYHHIVEYHQEPQFRPEDMMTLCPNCHDQASQGALSHGEQRHCKANPYNLRRGYANGLLKIDQPALALNLGGVQLVGNGPKLVVDGEPLLMISSGDSGRLEISSTLYDEHDDILARIDRNEWVTGSTLPWDLEARYKWLRVRSKDRKIALEIDAREFPVNVRAQLWRKGQCFSLSRRLLKFNGIVRNVGFKDLCFVGIHFVVDTKEGVFRLQPDQCFGKGMIVSEADLGRRIAKGIEAWNALVSN